MNNTIINMQDLKFFFTILLIAYCSNLKAQPGWRDFTKRYNYTILDKTGKEISFKDNTDYSIMIDNMLYKSPNIPQNPLKQASPSDKGRQNHIRINDFSLALPQKESFEQNSKRMNIKIIYKKDTMFICQPSGIGSIFETADFQDESIESPKADYILPFVSGHYYFPDWIKDISNNLPKISGKVKFLNTANLSQQYFIIPENIYNSSLLYNKNTYGEQRETDEDKYVIDNFFLKGYFSLDKRIEPTKINQLPSKYSWIGKPIPTRDPNRFWGMIDISAGITTSFSLYNEENTIELFFPKKETRNFSGKTPYVDTFGKVIYLPIWVKQESNDYISATVYNKIPPKKYIYSSKDEGRTWKEDKEVNAVFEKYSIFDKHSIIFIDKGYALVYYKKIVERDEMKNRIKEQGIYYLLKNMKVIDSLKTPKNDNFFGYTELSVQNDSVLLGKYWPDDYQNIYFHLSLKKINDNWIFQVDEKRYVQNSAKEQEFQKKDIVKEYKNFQLINNRELVFKNGFGKMILKDKYYDYSIFEKDNQIYLINYRSVYLSFDRGANWYVYPASILPNTYYYLLDISRTGDISYFSNNRTDSENSETRKIFYRFSSQ